jgi:hypothetical protein
MNDHFFLHVKYSRGFSCWQNLRRDFAPFFLYSEASTQHEANRRARLVYDEEQRAKGKQTFCLALCFLAFVGQNRFDLRVFNLIAEIFFPPSSEHSPMEIPTTMAKGGEGKTQAGAKKGVKGKASENSTLQQLMQKQSLEITIGEETFHRHTTTEGGSFDLGRKLYCWPGERERAARGSSAKG